MELTAVHAANHFLVAHDSVEDPVSLFERVSELLFLALVGAMLLAPATHRGRVLRRASVSALLSAGVALLAGAVISSLVDRSRPFAAHPHSIHLFAPHAADAGFPSDHATAAFAIAAAIFGYDRRLGSAVLALATLVAAGRVAIGVHYPSDVIAGALLGVAAAIVCARPAIRRRTEHLADRIGAYVKGLQLRGIRRGA
jgi:undecaprenyl-diphosphatase